MRSDLKSGTHAIMYDLLRLRVIHLYYLSEVIPAYPSNLQVTAL
jgi:hypothetical protein